MQMHTDELYLQVVGNEQLSEIVHLQHCGGVVLTDAVTLQQVLSGHRLPSQPTQVEGSVARKHVGQVAWLTAAACIVLLHALCDGLHLSLLAVRTQRQRQQSAGGSLGEECERQTRWPNCTSELQTPQLKSDQAVADLDQVDKGVEIVRSQNETVSCTVVAPSAQHKVATKGVLQRASQVLIKDGVQVAVITSCEGGPQQSVQSNTVNTILTQSKFEYMK